MKPDILDWYRILVVESATGSITDAFEAEVSELDAYESVTTVNDNLAEHTAFLERLDGTEWVLV